MPDFSPGLYVVATPIGNLQDLSPRARALLAAASIVAAEDTRTSGKLLDLAGSHARRVSLTEHNVESRAPDLIEAAKTAPVALVSDAGTPVVADPGARLIAAAHQAGIPVFAIPGPSALVAALSVSGFEGSDVHFLGFLPRQRSERLSRLRSAAADASVLVFFESPNRIAATLQELAAELGNPLVTVCRELTKLHEEVVHGPASDVATRLHSLKGEFTVVVQSPPKEAASEDDIRAYLGEMQRAGARRSSAAAEAARRFGIERQRAYALWPGEPA
ncbi:MAG TPA: 16S rRNA (cytidine(1402)-2'-O)-methyltransferase [Tepidiformaceae bacterium]|nr:16S rRNA (cytidine(1402)-2'-O)-methyltransferase [Tepidiformaceae bacterium]